MSNVLKECYQFKNMLVKAIEVDCCAHKKLSDKKIEKNF